MKLRYKILLGFGMVLAILLGIELYNIFFLRNTNQSIKLLVDKQFQTQKIMQEANVIVLNIHADLWDTMLFEADKKEDMKNQLKSNAKDFYEKVRALGEEVEEVEKSTDKIETTFRYYIQFGSSILNFESLEEFNSKIDVVNKFKENKLSLIETFETILDASAQEFESALEDLKQTFQTTIIVMIIVAIIAVLAGIILALYIAGMLTKPIEILMNTIQEVENDNYDVQARIITKDEIGKLGTSFNNMITQIKLSRQKLAESERLAKEMEIAEQIQTSLCPPVPEHPEFDIAAIMKPADEVGGDYYDIVTDNDNNLWFAIGDVSGHGLNSGLIMMMAQSSFVSSINSSATTASMPGRTIANVNELLYKNTKQRLKKKNFMTMTFLRYEGDGKFVHAGAHLDIIVYRAKEKKFETFETKGIYLGLKEDITKITFEGEFKLEKEDVMFLYSDGIIEVKDKNENLLNVEGLIEIIGKHVDKDVHGLRDNIIHDTLVWCNDRRDDDMTLMVVKRK